MKYKNWLIYGALWLSATAQAQDVKPLEWKPLYEPGGGGAITAVAVNPHSSNHLISLGDMLGVATSFDGGDSWQPTFGFTSYEFSGGVTFHPTDKNTIWIGSAMGPYKSTDGGINWVPKRQGMPKMDYGRYTAIVETVLYDPDQPNRLLTFGGTSRHWNQAETFGWIWESTDGGENWKHIGTIAQNGFTSEAKKGANIVWAAYAPGTNSVLHLLADGGGWFVSGDDGRTWKKQEYAGLPTAPRSISFHPKNANIIWATTGSYTTREGDATREPGGVYKSTDGGKTFVPGDKGITKVNAKSNGNLSSSFNNVVVSAANPDILFTNDGAWNASIIYKSTNGGANWFPVASREGIGVKHEAANQNVFNPKTATFAGISVRGVADPNNAERNYWYNTEFILRTRDGGQTWDDATAYQIDPQNKPDNWRGRGWVGWCATNFAWNPYRPGQAILQAMDAGKAWISDDNLQSWRYAKVPTHPWLGGVDASFTRDGHIFVTTGQFGANNGIMRSADWGQTWTLLEGEKRGLSKAGWDGKPEYVAVYAHPENSKLVWVTQGGNVLHSSDSGETWREISPLDKGGRRVGGAMFIAGDPTKAGRFYVAAKDGVYVTEDGLNFTNIGGPRPGGRGRINCDARGRVIVCQWRDGRSGVWRYAPATKEWQRLLDENLAFECVADPGDPTRLLMVTNMDPFNDYAGGNGVWISHDDGAIWSQQDVGLAMRRGQAVAINPHNPEQMVVGTFGRGFFITHWPRDVKPNGTRRYVQVEADRTAAAITEIKPFVLQIKNGAMTQGLDVPQDWRGKDGAVEVKRDTETFKFGPASLLVTVVGGKSGNAHQAVKGGASGRFKLAGWMKTRGNVKAQVAVHAFADGYKNNKWIQVQYLQGDQDWTRFEKEIELPEWTSFFNIMLHVEGDGKAWLDEVHEAASPVDQGREQSLQEIMTTQAPPKDKPSIAGWGFWPQFPQAWQQTHNGFVQRTKEHNVKPINIIFFGDSITQGWDKEIFGQKYAPLGAVNYGIGGDTTRQVLWRIQNGEVEGLNPKLIVLKIGTNNLYDDHNAGSDEEIAKGIETIIKTLREKLPNTRILLLGILPRQNIHFSGRARNINAIIKNLDDGKTVRFLDMSDQFQTELGKVKPELYSPDQLHLARPGYQLWADTMQPLFDEMLK